MTASTPPIQQFLNQGFDVSHFVVKPEVAKKSGFYTTGVQENL